MRILSTDRPEISEFGSVDPEPVVAESCDVALDLMKWVGSKRLEY